MDISENGARIRLQRPLSIGDAAILECAELELFGLIVRRESSGNGMEFETPLTPEQVLAIRAFDENFENIEWRADRNAARNWIAGGK